MRSKTITIVALAGLIGVACGSDDDSGAGTSSDTAAAEPVDTGPADTPEVTERGGIYSDPIETEAPSDGTSGSEPTDTADGDGAGAAPVEVATTDLGEVLVDTGGFVLYGFTPDEGGTPTCEDACADAWPPVVTDSADLPAGLDAAVFSVAERSDGSFQLAAGGWPLYRFAGDIAPGDTTGQGSGGVWFAAAPDGTLIM